MKLVEVLTAKDSWEESTLSEYFLLWGMWLLWSEWQVGNDLPSNRQQTLLAGDMLQNLMKRFLTLTKGQLFTSHKFWVPGTLLCSHILISLKTDQRNSYGLEWLTQIIKNQELFFEQGTRNFYWPYWLDG